MEGTISGRDVVGMLRTIFQTWIRVRIIFRELEPLSYERDLEEALESDNLRAHKTPLRKDWKLVKKYCKISLPPNSYPKGKNLGQSLS